MREDWEPDFSCRTGMLVGAAGVERLAAARVAVFGVGGVGGYVCEALARTGVGALDLFDHDTVALTDCNRQITALHSTLGRLKVEVMAARIRDINPACEVRPLQVFYGPEAAPGHPFEGYSYVVDAVDNISAKLEIIERAKAAEVPVISAMGAGNKLRPELFQIADIEKTSVCPLARVMRRELKKRGIRKVKVVFSTEQPVRCEDDPNTGQNALRPATGRPAPGSVVFSAGAMGLLLAGQVVRDLLSPPAGD